MKFYVVVRLSRSDTGPRKNVALPVIFTKRADAQETCDTLNEMKKRDDPGFIVEEREEIGKAFRRPT